MTQPVLYLAFANNQHHPFLNLSREQQKIYNLFVANPALKGFQIHTDSFATTESLVDYLIEFKNRVSIFHYAGHADRANLVLSDDNAGRNGLTSLLGRQKHLKCVFLNGCDTTGFVEKLLRQGVPVVVATDRKVDDESALTFAETFYKVLISGETLETAFDEAKAAVDLKNEGKVKVRTQVGRLIDAQQEGCPWGLYYNDPTALQWKLEDAKQDVLNLPRKFWIRFVILAALLFAAFTWSKIVIGNSPTQAILASGPLAVIGICSFLAKHLGTNFPNIPRQIAWFFLRTPVLALLVAAFVLISASSSSVRINHNGQRDLNPYLKNNRGKNWALAWAMRGESEDQTRLFAIGSPFGNKANLHIDGYKPKQISLRPWTTTDLDIRNFEVLSSLLIRVAPMDMPLIGRMKIEVYKPGDKAIVIESPDAPSIIIGARSQVPEDVKSEWEAYFSELQIPDDLKERCINRWKKPKQLYDKVFFVPEDKWNVRMYINNTLRITKEITIKNQPVNDVLLQH